MKSIFILLLMVFLSSNVFSKERCGIENMKIRQLDERELKALEHYRFWVNDVLERGFKLDKKLTGNETDLDLLQALLKNGPYGDNVEDELIIIGSTFGDVLAKKLNMDWIIYEDEYGADFALTYKNQCTFSFPQSMLLKRAEKGELGDLRDLFQETVELLKKEITRTDIETW